MGLRQLTATGVRSSAHGLQMVGVAARSDSAAVVNFLSVSQRANEALEGIAMNEGALAAGDFDARVAVAIE